MTDQHAADLHHEIAMLEAKLGTLTTAAKRASAILADAVEAMDRDASKVTQRDLVEQANWQLRRALR